VDKFLPKPLYHSPSSTAQGRKDMMKGSWVEISTGRDHSPITITDKRGWTWGKKHWIYHQSNQSRTM